MRYTTYIFDLFNTLLTADDYENVMASLFPEIDYRTLLRPILLKDNFKSMRHFLDYLESRFEVRYSTERRCNIFCNLRDWVNSVRVYDDVVRVLDHLHRRRIQLSIISNCNFFIERAFYRSSLDRYFATCFFSHRVGYAKPEREIYQTCFEQLKIDPARTIMIGDQPRKDVILPMEFGIDALLLDRQGMHKEFKNRITDLAELIKRI